MSKVTSITGEYTPLEIANRIPWDKIKHCVVIHEDENGDCVLNISDMDWKTRIWLSGELLNFNSAQGAVNYLELE